MQYVTKEVSTLRGNEGSFSLFIEKIKKTEPKASIFLYIVLTKLEEEDMSQELYSYLNLLSKDLKFSFGENFSKVFENHNRKYFNFIKTENEKYFILKSNNISESALNNNIINNFLNNLFVFYHSYSLLSHIKNYLNLIKNKTSENIKKLHITKDALNGELKISDEQFSFLFNFISYSVENQKLFINNNLINDSIDDFLLSLSKIENTMKENFKNGILKLTNEKLFHKINVLKNTIQNSMIIQ